MDLTEKDRAILGRETGTEGHAMAMEIVTEAARMLGADRLVPIVSSHIDGCLYLGQAGALFAERLADRGARVSVPATTNVGALNLLNPDLSRLTGAERRMAYRQMVAYQRMGCQPSWTCAPYQAGARPGLGDQVAWGESNAVAFVNTVLGARTNRYGDFLDIACAVAGQAPYYGLHVPRNRRAELVFDVSGLAPTLWDEDAAYPVLGALVGRRAGDAVAAVVGLPAGPSRPTEDQLKAFCAAAAATGAVALTHIVGRTPEAQTLKAVAAERVETVTVTQEMIIGARDSLSLAPDGPIDSLALGSPHFSAAECRALVALAGGRRFHVPVYVCLGRHTLEDLARDGTDRALTDLGVTLVADTCVVVTPILPPGPGVMMTNSAKFAHYATGNTGHLAVFGTLGECVVSAQAGRVKRDARMWT